MKRIKIYQIFMLALFLAAVTGCSQEKKSTEKDKPEPVYYEIPGQVSEGFSTYLDYAEDKGDRIELEFILEGMNTVFSEEINQDMVSFSGDLESLHNVKLEITDSEGTEAKLIADISNAGKDAEALSLCGSIILEGRALLDKDLKPFAEPCSVTNQFTFTALDKSMTGESKAEVKTDWKVSNDCLEIIKKYEGCRLKAYQNTAGFWVIGYGHSNEVKEGDEFSTMEEADEVLRKDLSKYEKYINKLIEKKKIRFALTQHQFDALVSFAWDAGFGNLDKLVIGKSAVEIADEILRYNRNGGKVLNRTVKRRNDERTLFLKNYSVQQETESGSENEVITTETDEQQTEIKTDWKASDACIEIIKKYEKCSLKAYQNSAGVWIIGYGHSNGVKKGDKFSTTEEAEEVLREDLSKYEKYINTLIENKKIRFALTQHQFDALVSFAWDAGFGNLDKLVTGKSAMEISDEILRYNKAGGKVIERMVKRREDERKLFLN